jgi:WD40 repeat protein
MGRWVLDLFFSPDGKWVAISATRRKLQIYRVAQQQPFRIERYAQLLGHEGLLQHLTFASDSRHLLSGSTDQTVRIWDPMRSAETGARPHRRLVQELVCSSATAPASAATRWATCAPPTTTARSRGSRRSKARPRTATR